MNDRSKAFEDPGGPLPGTMAELARQAQIDRSLLIYKK